MTPVAEPAGNREERQEIPQRTGGAQDDYAHWFTTAKPASASCCGAAKAMGEEVRQAEDETGCGRDERGEDDDHAEVPRLDTHAGPRR